MNRFTATALALPIALAGCGTERPEDRTALDVGAPAPAVTAAQACPDQLAGDAHGTPRAEVPAEGPPGLDAPMAIWVCTYSTLDRPDPGVLAPAWRRVGAARRVEGPSYAVLARGLRELAPAAPDRVCTADLGPRVLVGHVAADGNLTGVVVDLYGCREVRLTPDPATVPPGGDTGADTPSGVLAGTAEFTSAVAAQSTLLE